MAEPADPAAPSVLVVDDEPAVHEVFSRVFEKLGYRFEAVSTSEEGFAKVATRHFDVFLLDKNLPGQSGVALARAVRASQPEAIVILITGYASRASADELVGVADEYLTKPFDLDRVRETVTALLAQRGPARPPPAWTAPAPGKKSVHVATDVPSERELLGGIVSGLQARSTTGEVLAQPEAPEVLVLAASVCSFETRKAVWAWQAKSPGLRVVLIVDPASPEDAATAVALKASWRISRPIEPRSAQVILQRALE